MCSKSVVINYRGFISHERYIEFWSSQNINAIASIWDSGAVSGFLDWFIGV
jgi:hypothetical protein